MENSTRMEHALVQMIRDCVKTNPKPCVYIGGGIDSTIILHHLHEKTSELIYTYTFGFEDQETEFNEAQQVAEHYETKHREIKIINMLDKYSEILKHFDRPQFNIWVYWLAKAAHQDDRHFCYSGEGGDEHFGGYWYKPHQSYLQNWTTLYEWGLPAYQTVHKIFDLQFLTPFLNLDWRDTYNYYDYEQHKRYLKEAYRGVIPDFVLNRKKNPASRNYWILWENELKSRFPNVSLNPQTAEHVRNLFNVWVMKEWLKIHGEMKNG